MALWWLPRRPASSSARSSAARRHGVGEAALPPGINYVQEGTENKLELQTAPLLPTDAVVDVFALDRSLFDAANARQVARCNGAHARRKWRIVLRAEFLRGNAVRPAVDGATCTILSHRVPTPDLQPRVLRHKNMELPPWADQR